MWQHQSYWRDAGFKLGGNLNQEPSVAILPVLVTVVSGRHTFTRLGFDKTVNLMTKAASRTSASAPTCQPVVAPIKEDKRRGLANEPIGARDALQPAWAAVYLKFLARSNLRAYQGVTGAKAKLARCRWGTEENA